MKRLTVMALVLAVMAGSGMATSFLGRSSTMNEPFQFFGWTNFGYNQTALSYDTTTGKYDTPSGFVTTKTMSCDVTLALGLPGKLDIDLVAPLAMKEKGEEKSSGMGDLMVYARYGLLQSSLLPVKAALIFGANLPTADTAVPKAVWLSDRTVDLAFGVSANTMKIGGFLGHVRAAYWLNGKLPDTDKKVGNMIEYNLTLDYSVTKTLTPEVAVTGYSRAQTDSSGTSLANTEVSQHVVNVLLMWKPISMLTIRPKVAFPLTAVSKGGSMANIYGGLDVWVFLP